MRKIILFLLLAFMAVGVDSFAQSRHDNARQRDAYEHRGRHHKSPYLVTGNKVFFKGRVIEGASASGFRILGDGYAKDPWNVYFAERK